MWNRLYDIDCFHRHVLLMLTGLCSQCTIVLLTWRWDMRVSVSSRRLAQTSSISRKAIVLVGATSMIRKQLVCCSAGLGLTDSDSCGHCRYCLDGKETYCPERAMYGKQCD